MAVPATDRGFQCVPFLSELCSAGCPAAFSKVFCFCLAVRSAAKKVFCVCMVVFLLFGWVPRFFQKRMIFCTSDFGALSLSYFPARCFAYRSVCRARLNIVGATFEEFTRSNMWPRRNDHMTRQRSSRLQSIQTASALPRHSEATENPWVFSVGVDALASNC